MEKIVMKIYLPLLSILILLSNVVYAQDIQVRGTVISSDDSTPLPGASVIIKGKTTGAVTDLEGNYSIRVPEGAALLFSSVGFVTKEVAVKGQTVVNVLLDPDFALLDEVVVVGYGEQRKSSVVGAISNIKNDDLKMAAPSNLSSAIAGRVTGALVRLGDGNIGGGDNRYSTQEMDNADIFIRGRATPNSAQPLVLVDGVESSFSRINPEDIAQFSVLKDASATAVYGVRGANGVMLITTKRGAMGKPRISLNSQIRMHQPLKFPKPLGAYDYAVLYNEALRNVGKAPLYSADDLKHWELGDDPIRYPDVSWYDEVVKNHFFEQQHNLNISGGTSVVKYYISGEYNHAGGPFRAGPGLENTYDRYNLRTNFDFNVTPSTLLSISLNGRMEEKGDVLLGEGTGQRYYGSLWWSILSTLGNVAPVKYPNGTWAFGTSQSWNIMSNLQEGGYRMRSTNAAESRISLKQQLDFILKGLSFRIMHGAVISSGTRKVIGPERIPALWDYNPDTEVYTLRKPEEIREYGQENIGFSRRYHFETALDYSHTFFDKHRVGGMATYIQTTSESNAVLPVSYRGVSGRITYDYDSKYLAEFNMGYNGSDQFSKGKRYAFLPAFSLGWVLSEEKFFKKLTFVDFLKIRGSYGTAGNDKIGGYRYLYQYLFQPIGNRYTQYWQELYNFGETPVSEKTGLREGTLGNDNVTWEISKKANIGIDLLLFKKKVNFTGDIFLEKRNNILVKRKDVPTQTGLTSGRLPAQNLGRVSNRGFELSLNYADKFGDFGFAAGGNYTFARSNVDYIAEVQKEYAYQMQKNHPIGQTFGYVWTGKFYDRSDLTNPDIPKPSGTLYPGDLMYEDINKDGKINDFDITAIGHPTIPEIVYGINLSLSYKGVYLNSFWQGASNVSSRYGKELRYEFVPNVLPIHLDRWVYDPEKGLDTRETAKYPSLIIGGSTQTKMTSTFQLLNSEYLRLKSLEFGYNFDSILLRKMKLSALKIFLTGSNLLTFDHIKYLDPEYESNSRGNYYPQTKFYALGINVTF